jgi:hypothetical protein
MTLSLMPISFAIGLVLPGAPYGVILPVGVDYWVASLLAFVWSGAIIYWGLTRCWSVGATVSNGIVKFSFRFLKGKVIWTVQSDDLWLHHYRIDTGEGIDEVSYISTKNRAPTPLVGWSKEDIDRMAFCLHKDATVPNAVPPPPLPTRSSLTRWYGRSTTLRH